MVYSKKGVDAETLARLFRVKDPLILSFSPRGEGTPELSPRVVRASSLPLGRETE
jgi:hypothetical protein